VRLEFQISLRDSAGNHASCGFPCLSDNGWPGKMKASTGSPVAKVFDRHPPYTLCMLDEVHCNNGAGMLGSLREFLSLARIAYRIPDARPDAGSLLKCWRHLRRHAKMSAPGPCQTTLGPLTIYGHNYPDLLDVFEEIVVGRGYHVVLPVSQPVIFDCGANIGMATLFFKLYHPHARMTCFEPNPECFSRLKQNIETNKLADVVLVPAACGANEDPVTFYTIPNRTLGSSANEAGGRENPAPPTSQTVPQVRVSTYISGPVDLFKLDVEGAEWAVMEDLVASGKIKLIARLIIEFHLRFQSAESNLGRFLTILENHGFTYTIESTPRLEKRFTSAWQALSIFAIRTELLPKQS
jgi:FkbM family methyltransferase